MQAADDYRMFSEEISRLEAEAQEVQHLILNHTERLRQIEQRILALKSVLAGSEARTTAFMSAGLDRAVAERALPTESDIRAERGALNSSLYGVQRAFAPIAVDTAAYRGTAGAARQPFANRIGVPKRGAAAKSSTAVPATKSAIENGGPHVDTTS